MSGPILFLLGQMHVGGIETVALNAMNALAGRGEEVILIGDSAAWSDRIDQRVARVGMIAPWPSAHLPQGLLQRIAGRDVIYVTLHPWALVSASQLARRLRSVVRSARAFHLVTHSRAFFFETRFPFSHRILQRAFAALPVQSAYFMNEAALLAHAEEWRMDLSAYPILTLPMPATTVRWRPSKGPNLSLVSVGRLVPFKGYNRRIPAIVRSLRDKGLDLRWTIWGYGPDEEVIRAEIARCGVASHVELKGALDHACYDEEVASHDLFVGMGSSLLEAGRLGMPAVTAVEQSEEDSYGFLFETPIDSVGDVVAGAAVRPLSHIIEAYAALTPEERITAGERCRADSLRRSTSLDDMCDAIVNAGSWHLPPDRVGTLVDTAMLLARHLLHRRRRARTSR
jgi:glycosyltransferase involved in cell wall biosynthesis